MEKKELLKKIKALSEHGIGGEKDNAEKLLSKLLAKYNISEVEIVSDTVNKYEIKYRNSEKQLLEQVAYSVLGENLNTYKYKYLRKKALFVECTLFQSIEIKSKYEHYSRAYRKQLDIFHHAFIIKNNIYPENQKSQAKKLSPEEKAALEMSLSIEKNEYRKQIGMD